LVSDIPAGDGKKPLTFFYSVYSTHTKARRGQLYAGIKIFYAKFLLAMLSMAFPEKRETRS
jgi:hypothetical protein